MAFGSLMPLVRKYLYVPDGRCPTKIKGPKPWDERRDGSILKRLCAKYGMGEVSAAIKGLALLRDAGELSWAKPHSKMTLRALHYTHVGCEDVFHMARYTYHRSLNHRNSPVVKLGALLRGNV